VPVRRGEELPDGRVQIGLLFEDVSLDQSYELRNHGMVGQRFVDHAVDVCVIVEKPSAVDGQSQ
jgi:hypothetical protein